MVECWYCRDGFVAGDRTMVLDLGERDELVHVSCAWSLYKSGAWPDLFRPGVTLAMLEEGAYVMPDVLVGERVNADQTGSE
jgi:hypothetical protein